MSTIIVVAGLACLLVVVLDLLSWRTIVFTVDGETILPQGLPLRPRVKKLNGHNDNLTSLEIFEDTDGYWVRAFSKGGDTMYIAVVRYQDRARKIAVQLTNALQEIRSARSESLGAASNGSVAPDDLINKSEGR